MYILTRILHNYHLPPPSPYQVAYVSIQGTTTQNTGADQCKVLGNCPDCVTTPPQFTLSLNSMLTSDLGKISGQGWGDRSVVSKNPMLSRSFANI